jgi:hypothetical protein
LTNVQKNTVLDPVWTVLGGKYIWVNYNGTAELHTITVGKTYREQIGVAGGLSVQGKIITDPRSITSKQYQFL